MQDQEQQQVGQRADDADGCEPHRLAGQARRDAGDRWFQCAPAKPCPDGCDGQLPRRQRVTYPHDAFQVGDSRRNDIDSAVRVINPVDGDLGDPEP